MRNEHEQAVRTADDVFDIYERAAGGNGVFLLNVPPDKSGRIAPRDAACLAEVGRRIRATYVTRDVMAGATSAGRINYTTDGSEPSPNSPCYDKPFALPGVGRVRAVAIVGGHSGPPCDARVSIDHRAWKIRFCSSEQRAEFSGAKSIDGDPSTFWHSRWSPEDPHPHCLEIDLGREHRIGGITYLPRQDKAVPDGMVEAGEISFSRDGGTWSKPQPFRLGNLINDPSERFYLLDNKSVNVRFVRFTSTAGAAG